jgi:hypothetical protein
MNSEKFLKTKKTEYMLPRTRDRSRHKERERKLMKELWFLNLEEKISKPKKSKHAQKRWRTRSQTKTNLCMLHTPSNTLDGIPFPPLSSLRIFQSQQETRRQP